MRIFRSATFFFFFCCAAQIPERTTRAQLRRHSLALLNSSDRFQREQQLLMMRTVFSGADEHLHRAVGAIHNASVSPEIFSASSRSTSASHDLPSDRLVFPVLPVIVRCDTGDGSLPFPTFSRNLRLSMSLRGSFQ